MIISALNFKKYFYNLSLFRIVYVISLFFESVCFSETLFGYINGIFIFWGFIIFLHNVFNSPEIFNIEHKREASFFILINIFTSFFNFSSNILMNIITSFHNFMCMFLFLGMKKNTPKESIEKEMALMLKFIIYFSILFSLGGFYSIFLPKSNLRIGIYENRFYGISTNPNQAGLISVISIFSCDLLNNLKYKIKKFTIIFCLILNLITLFLTDSNASFVFLVSYIGVNIICETFLKYEKIKEMRLAREILFIFTCLVMIISSSFLLRTACQSFVSKFLSSPKSENKLERNFISEKTEKSDEIELGKYKENVEIKLGRGNHEISSGRIQLFKQGVKLAKIHPLFGLGRENLPYYGKIYLNGGLAFPSKHQDLHNIYITLISSYGWIGFLLFMIFIIKNIKKIIFETFTSTSTKKAKIISKFLSIIVAYFAYGNFEIGIMSGMFLSDILIWLFFGYALSHE